MFWRWASTLSDAPPEQGWFWRKPLFEILSFIETGVQEGGSPLFHPFPPSLDKGKGDNSFEEGLKPLLDSPVGEVDKQSPRFLFCWSPQIGL